MRTRASRSTVFLTGATGLVGARVLQRLVAEGATVCCLVREPRRFATAAAALDGLAGRTVAVRGDVRLAALGITRAARARLGRAVTTVVHCAADTSFSQPLPQARAINTSGTAHLLDLAHDWPVERFVHVSTAFVAGRRTGSVAEAALDADAGFVNGYEQSKHEAEALVRRSALPWSIARPSTIVCDDASGRVSQHNAVHRALRVFHAGLASLMPGGEDTPVDLVTTDYVADGIVRIAASADAAGATYHLCAGEGAMPLGELLDRCHAFWSRDAAWRRRGIARPALTDLATYRLFEASVEETDDVRLATITRSLSHFVPQLALPKRFETQAAGALIGAGAPPVSSFWDALLAELAGTAWGARARSAA
jgi:thioester reductase-like protein